MGTDTPKLCATSYGGVPLANSFLAASILPSVIWRFRPPTRPWRLAACTPMDRREAGSDVSVEVGDGLFEVGQIEAVVAPLSIRILIDEVELRSIRGKRLGNAKLSGE